VMQALWLAFESIAGKGISLFFILKFLYYTSLIVSAQALPIAVLLSSIMAMGNLSENYEFAAIKSASISLMRLLRPLIILTLILSVFNFFFLNNIYPFAVLKQKNLMLNIRKKKPALALIPGSFNTEIPDYQIKFDEKYGEEENFLKKVLIYDLSSGRGNKKVITAERGKIVTEEGSKYMTFILYNGNYYEEHTSKVRNVRQQDKMPASSAEFEEYAFNIDISSFSEDDLDEEKFKNSYNMLSLNQLSDTIPVMKVDYDQFVESKAKSIYKRVNAQRLYEASDSIQKRKLEPNIYDNFDLNGKVSISDGAINSIKSTLNNAKSYNKTMKIKRKRLNLYDIEYHNRIAFSLSCLILFFIGAPLGSIIRKGGFGLPMILAISIYVIYFFVNTFGRNMAEESSLTAVMGSWVSTAAMIPFAFLLTRRASKGMALFDIQSITRFFKKEKEEKHFVIEEAAEITPEDRLITEKFKPLSDNQLIDIIQNYRQYKYTKGQREVGLELLAERGITKEELVFTGRFENQQHKEAIESYDSMLYNSKIALILYGFSLVLNILLQIAIHYVELNATVKLIGTILILYALNIAFLFFAIRSILNYDRINKALKKPRSIGNYIVLFLFGLPFYLFLYFYTRKETKEKIEAIR
jgi:lipopolysaccharide export system permease protein